MSYYEKIIVTQGICEVWRYEKLNVKSGGYHEPKGLDQEHNYEESQKRRRNRIRQLIANNFDSGSKFVTLTFRDDVPFRSGGKTVPGRVPGGEDPGERIDGAPDAVESFLDVRDVKSCNAYFKRFIDRLRRRYGAFKYLAVIEFQDGRGRGAVHYHMISDLPYIRKSVFADIWGAGFVQINKIDHVDNVGAYVIKYMTKDMKDRRLAGENAYLHSRGLLDPVELTTWRDPDREAWREIHAALENETPSYSAKYESEASGEISYFQYNFNRKT